MLRELWDLGTRAAPMNVFRGYASSKRFREQVATYRLSDIDPERKSLHAFERKLAEADEKASGQQRPNLRERFEELTRGYSRDGASPANDIASKRSEFVGELRALLAASCIAALEPDLIILDEFQRFGHLLDGTDRGKSGSPESSSAFK